MKIGVSLKIDVSKIDKSMLFKGQKGTYLDAKVFIDIDQKDQYDNNGMITQEVSKDAPQGTQGAILGNCRVFWNEPSATGSATQKQGGQMPSQQLEQKRQLAQQQQKVNPQEPSIDFDDDIPF